jgi:hypothetical protein
VVVGHLWHTHATHMGRVSTPPSTGAITQRRMLHNQGVLCCTALHVGPTPLTIEPRLLGYKPLQSA